MKALVTGANGLIGSNLVRELITCGYGVRAFVRPGSDLRSLTGLPIEIAYGDVLAKETLIEASHGCQLLFHTAAVFAFTGHSADELNSVAVDGVRNAIESAGCTGVRRIVLTASSVAFGSSDKPLLRDENSELCDPDPPSYAVSKTIQLQTALQVASQLGVDLVAVCPTMSIGPHGYRLGPSNGLIVAYLNDQLRSTFLGGCNIVSVIDVARGHILAAERGKTSTAYILGSENLKWPVIHRMLSELCGVPGPFLELNCTSSYLAAIYEELYARLRRRSPALSRTQAKMVGRYYWYSHNRASTLGYAPRPARQALAEAVSWLATSEHISRETRSTMTLSDEVYAARKALNRKNRELYEKL